MARRRPLVVAIQAGVDGAIRSMRQLAGAVDSVSDAADAADDSVSNAGETAEERAKAAQKALRSLSVKSEAVADAQIARIEQTKSTLRELRRTGEISADEYARAFETAERRISAINRSIARDTRTTAQKLSESFNKIGAGLRNAGLKVGAAVGAAATAGAVAGVAAANGLAERGQTVRIGAQVSGLDGNDADLLRFQKFAAAVRFVGFDAEKAGDLLKDFNDKLGDLQLGGAGGLKDFAETIGVRSGIFSKSVIGDEEQLKKEANQVFSGMDSLQAFEFIIQAIEKSGGKIQDFSFLLEALAGDATRLVPLFENGAVKFREMGDAFEKSGAALTEADLAKLDEFAAAQNGLMDAFQALGIAMLRAGALDALNSMIDWATDIVKWIGEKVNPGFLKFGAIIAAIVLAVGPLLVILGLVIAAFGGVAAALSAIGSAIGVVAVLSAIGAAIYGLVQLLGSAWEKIKGILPDWITGGGPSLTDEQLGAQLRAASQSNQAPAAAGVPINLNVGGSEYALQAAPDVADALARNQSLKAGLRPAKAPRTFR